MLPSTRLAGAVAAVASCAARMPRSCGRRIHRRLIRRRPSSQRPVRQPVQAAVDPRRGRRDPGAGPTTDRALRRIGRSSSRASRRHGAVRSPARRARRKSAGLLGATSTDRPRRHRVGPANSRKPQRTSRARRTHQVLEQSRRGPAEGSRLALQLVVGEAGATSRPPWRGGSTRDT